MPIADQIASLNRLARRTYRGLLSRHPRLARGARAALYPLLIGLNRRLARRDYVALFSPPADAGLAARFQREIAAEGFAPLVSVIVPNYNHAAYLGQRLASIAAQTYPHLELILLDDASTDGSAEILRDWQVQLADRFDVRVIVNAQNSGSPFAQWQRGIAEARGDLVWIAESDDWADPAFLERLVPAFANPAVRLGFGRAVFHDGTAMRGAMEDHVADGAALYAAPFRLTGPEAVRRGFGEANLIPNVSAALFRRPGDLSLYEAEFWRGMRVCGDWLFYLNLMRGGLLAFEPGALSFYRIHGQNSSIAAHQRDDFYAEHGAIAAAIARHYGRQPDARAALLARLGQIWRGARSDPPERLGPIFADAEAKAPQSAAKQRILMLSAGFSVGGAESFAVSLANLLRRAGHSVSFLDCGLEPAQPALRARLSPDIPLLSDSSDLTAILRDFDIEIAHSHHAWVDQALLDADPAAAARVVTLHGMYETLPKAQRARLIARLGNVADGLAAPASRNLEGLAPGRGTLIANAAEPAHAAPIPRAALGVPEGAFLIALVSRAVPEKGWTEAIAATRAARSISGRDIHLLLTGAGPEHDRLKSAALPDFVHLTGLRGDVGAIFAAADLAILPSRYKGESYPMVILEALGAGTPVLASDLGQIAQMLTRPSRRAGEVIALKGWELDTESWAARIAALATGEAALALMRAAIPYLLDGGDAERMRCAYESLYQDALGRAASRAQTGSEDKE